ncbi:MAG TPA: hypothetical protein VMG09_18695 [Bacteroidota bacterium]|nr:hypothetical protein [Bacteroidota bacterium]
MVSRPFAAIFVFTRIALAQTDDQAEMTGAGSGISKENERPGVGGM